MSAQVLTKTLPPVPPPPRSVIIEKLPPLPPKPRDIVIERWIPYESTMQKRKVVVERAEEAKAYPPPKNIIIEYDKIETQIVRQIKRLGISPEDPENYTARYGHSLLDIDELLAQVKQLGITEDLSIPRLPDHQFSEKIASSSLEQNFSYENSFQQQSFAQPSPRATALGPYTTEKVLYRDTDGNNYAPTYENLVHGSGLSIQFDDLHGHTNVPEPIGEDLSTQLAQYGLTTESIPY